VVCDPEKVYGPIKLSPMDMLPLFRGSGTGPTAIKLLTMPSIMAVAHSLIGIARAVNAIFSQIVDDRAADRRGPPS